ncbi:acetate--CoA ligase family protein [Variovorax dokdonensis]|uniref:Acetate--CoA ligase family protein n=1 Tax=Variovorax dokdonensis TaxID=344883 RepID=A0ABT7NGL6_9BURK|nr:acetate--CoA ligase family protein [Variovorax dokdonensis]MDM0047102.1 acetate--CoA ligase family protein [Variovorax dokdonensis]
MSLQALFHPRRVAIVGASSQPQKIGGLPVRMLRELGYAGEILPVNPGAAEIQGLRAWPSLRALPDAPDVAIVAVPAAAVSATIEDCIGRGVGAAVVFSSGFAEAGSEGLAMQQRIAGLAREGGLTLLGPNCLGVINVRQRWVGTFSPAPLSGLPDAGGVAIVSQSGAFGAYAYVLARKAGLGLSQWVTTGNEAQVSVADLIDWLADDEETRVIVAYIEGARDGERLRQALLKARRAGKPVVVTKVGRTAAGASAAMSHTASLSGEDAVYQAVFEECGAVRAYTVEEMFRHAQAFATAPCPRGRRLGIITVSGGVGTLMADAASDAALELPPLPQDIATRLRERVPFASTANPVDVTGQITADYDVLEQTAVDAARSGAYDAVALFLAAAASAPALGPKVIETVRRIREAAPHLPLALSGILNAEQSRELQTLGCLACEEPTHAVEAMARLERWQSFAPAATPPSVPLARLPAGTRNEAEGLAWLAAQDLPVMPHRVVHGEDQAVQAWRELGEGPVVIKVVSRDILHKSDVGGVRVGPRSDAEVREACRAIGESVACRAPQAAREGLLVARLLKPRVELMLGARHDPVFGPIVVVGLGGVAVELHAKTFVLSAPAAASRVRELLGRLGVSTLMGAWRGQAVIDDASLVQAVLRFSQLAAGLGASLRSLEINPLMVCDDGVFAADSVIEIDA